MTVSIVRATRRLDLETFSRAAGMHPELIRRLVALGLLEPEPGPGPPGTLWFGPTQLREVARIRRLRAGLGLNYAAVGVVLQLLDRVAVLERQAHRPAAR